MSKILCIGESLIDMIPSQKDTCAYRATAGGAPANVCAFAAKLGAKTRYIGKLSTDGLSDIIMDRFKSCGVDTQSIVRDRRYRTAIALVTVSNDGERNFSFYRDNTADLMLCEDDIKADAFEKGDILHFCSVGLVGSPSKLAHKKAVALAREKGTVVSFDVNIRTELYPNTEACRSAVLEFLPYADIVKVTEEELRFVTGEDDEKESVKKLFELSPCAKIIFITRGANGADAYDRSLNGVHQDALKIRATDTTGAGDCFVASMLYNILQNGFCENAEGYSESLQFAMIECARVCLK